MARILGALKRWWLAIAAIAAGIGALRLSWIVGDVFTSEVGAWWASVLAEVGAAVLLVAPIAWASDRLTRQVEGVREGVEEVRAESSQMQDDVRRVREETSETIAELRQEVASLRELDARVKARRNSEFKQEISVYRRLGLDGMAPSREDVITAIKTAQENGVVEDTFGPRVEISPGEYVYLGLKYEPTDPEDGALFFVISSHSGDKFVRVSWDHGVSTTDAMRNVAKSLRSQGVSPSFDAGEWFRRMSETLVVASSHIERHQIVQLCPPQWVVTRTGIVPYPDHPLDGLGSPSIKNSSAIAAFKKKTWVDPDSLEDAAFAWKSLFLDPLSDL